MLGSSGAPATDANNNNFLSRPLARQQPSSFALASLASPLLTHNESRRREDAPTYITAPYAFAGSDMVGCTMASTLIIDDVHIGQASVDFIPSPIIDSTSEENTPVGTGEEAFTFVITSEDDHLDNNVIAGPGFSFSTSDGDHIVDLVIGGKQGDELMEAFSENVVGPMQADDAVAGVAK
jgi:hypothetical protein